MAGVPGVTVRTGGAMVGPADAAPARIAAALAKSGLATDVSPRACLLSGYPRVQFFGGSFPNWRAMTVRVVHSKQKRERLLPLPAVVAKALVSYLKNGRPATESRVLFVRDLAPFDQMLTVDHVCRLARRVFARYQIDAHPYNLRHTWATHAHRQGAGLKLIADVLGHHCLDSTMRYALVNLEQLRQVALPWPKIKR